MLMKDEPRTQAKTQKEFWAMEEFVFGKDSKIKPPNINTETYRKNSTTKAVFKVTEIHWRCVKPSHAAKDVNL